METSQSGWKLFPIQNWMSSCRFELIRMVDYEPPWSWTSEQIPSHSLKVRAFDPHGGILEQNFIIEVMDAFLPIVDTIPLQASAGVVSRLSLGGRVLDPGGSSEISEVGFLISRSPILDENDPCWSEFLQYLNKMDPLMPTFPN